MNTITIIEGLLNTFELVAKATSCECRCTL